MSKKKYYWDSCIFYEWLGNEDADTHKKNGVLEILKDNEENENLIMTSIITHLEVLPTKLDEKGVKDKEDYLSLFDAEKFAEIEINSNILMLARDIRDYYYQPQTDTQQFKMMDMGDAIHLATAAIHGADEFHTRDNSKKREKVPLLSLYEHSGNPKLCGRFDLEIVSPESKQGSLELDD